MLKLFREKKNLMFTWFFKKFQINKRPKKKVRYFRKFLEILPPLITFNWLKKKFKAYKNDKPSKDILSPTKEEEGWRIDIEEVGYSDEVFEDYLGTVICPTVTQWKFDWLRSYSWRIAYNRLYFPRRSWWRPFQKGWLRYSQLGNPDKIRLYAYKEPMDWAFNFDQEGETLGYERLSHQFYYAFSRYKFRYMVNGAPLLSKVTNRFPFSTQPFQYPFEIFSLFDRFIRPIYNIRKRAAISNFAVWRQAYYDLRYKLILDYRDRKQRNLMLSGKVYPVTHYVGYRLFNNYRKKYLCAFEARKALVKYKQKMTLKENLLLCKIKFLKLFSKIFM